MNLKLSSVNPGDLSIFNKEITYDQSAKCGFVSTNKRAEICVVKVQTNES